MNRPLQETLRWATIIGCLAFAAWALVSMRPWRCSFEDGFNVGMTLMMCCLGAFLFVPPLAVAYFCFRRQYRKIYYVVGVVGAVIVFGGLVMVSLPTDLKKIAPQDMNAGQSFMMLASAFYVLFVPAFAAAGFYRLCRWLAYRNQQPADQPRVKTRATWWLIWLGVACNLLPTLIMMGRALNQIAAAPPGAKPMPVEDISNSLSLAMGLAMFGTVLMFLGFVIRKPVKTPAVAAEPATPLPASTTPGDGVAE